MEVAGSAATIIQLISFTGEVLVAGYGYLKKVKNAPAEVRILLREAANLDTLLDQLHSMAAEDEKDVAKSALEKLASLGIFEDCDRLLRVIWKSIIACEQISGEGVKNTTKRLLWPFKEKETKASLQQLGRLRETLSAAILVDSAKTLQNIDVVAKSIDNNVIKVLENVMQLNVTAGDSAEEVKQLKDFFDTKVAEEKWLAVKRWLYPEDTETEAQLEAALHLRHPSTGTWFFRSDKFLQWLAGPNGSCIWLHGIAGSGKTILSASIIHHLRQSTVGKTPIVVYFFCDNQDPSKKTFQRLLQVLAKQLVELNATLLELATSFYNARWNEETHEIKPLSISDYIQLFHHLCSSYGEIFIVVDALDECTNLQAFVEGLRSLTLGRGVGANIRLIITSRQEISLERTIKLIATSDINLTDHMREDIKTYLSTEIQRRIDEGALKMRRKELATEIQFALEEKADGMILIAKLHLDYICGLKSDRAIKEALVKLPSTINATYDKILLQLYSKHPESIEEIKLMLQWLVASIVPLTLGELAEAVSIRPSDAELDNDGITNDVLDLADSCGSLVTIRNGVPRHRASGSTERPANMVITLAHASVVEYLTSGITGRDMSTIFNIAPGNVHHKLAMTCLQYIRFQNFQTPLRVPVRARRGHTLRQRTSRYAFYKYACLYWPDHLRLSNTTGFDNEEVSRLLGWFVVGADSGIYVSWQQMYLYQIAIHHAERLPLYYAIDFKIDWLVSALLQTLENVNTLYRGLSPLHVASGCGALSTVQYLLSHGASIDLKSSSTAKGMTALHFAAETGQTEVVKALIAAGACVDARSGSLTTPLYRAVRHGNLETAEVLYRAGSDINAKTWDSWTALLEALLARHMLIVSKLLEWGANPTIGVGGSMTPLRMMASAKGVSGSQLLLDIQDLQQRSARGEKNLFKDYCVSERTVKW